jgi:tRNA(Ile)-lysidine synthase
MLQDRVRAFVRRHELFGGDTRIVAAVSGGSDSVALLHLLHELERTGDVRLVGAAHFNHELRELADRDEGVAADAARAVRVPFAADRGDVRARARRERRSIEDAARACRYEFFERAVRKFGADGVALGHTRDDQAETVLLRLTRGAGPRGLAAMAPRRGAIVRPLLDVRRAELRAYLDARGVAYVDDETNADVRVPRNRVRAELLPLLAERFNPAMVDALAHEATIAREMWEWALAAADELIRRVVAVDRHRGAWRLDRAEILAAPAALRRLVVWRAMTEAAGSRSVSFEQADRALRLMEAGGADGGFDGPGQRVERSGDSLVLRGTARGRPGRGPGGSAVNLFEYPLSIPGEVHLVQVGCAVSAEALGPGVDPTVPRQAASGRGEVALVRRDLCGGPLAVRNRRPGDRFRPVGLGGRKKLQDYLVDRKIALARRDAIPLVVDDRGRIVWVAGLGIDEEFQVTDASQSVLLLRLKPLGGRV